jgi:hypothetical protein
MLCKCGCGEEIVYDSKKNTPSYIKKYGKDRYIHLHSSKGKTNAMWKGGITSDINKYQREKRKENSEHIRKRDREHYYKNRDKKKKLMLENYKKNNKKRVLYRRKYVKDNPELIRLSHRREKIKMWFHNLTGLDKKDCPDSIIDMKMALVPFKNKLKTKKGVKNDKNN